MAQDVDCWQANHPPMIHAALKNMFVKQLVVISSQQAWMLPAETCRDSAISSQLVKQASCRRRTADTQDIPTHDFYSWDVLVGIGRLAQADIVSRSIR